MRMQLGQSPVVGVEPAVYAPKALLLPSQYAAPHPGHVYDGPSAASADADAREAHASLQRMKAEAPAVSTGLTTGMATGMSASMATPATTSMATSMAMSTAPAAPERKRKPAKREVFVCPEVHCGKQFPRSFALRRHMRIHTGTKPYACDYEGCTQRFNTSGNLSRHKRIHSGERPYPCVFETCGKRFNTSTKLKRHMRIHFPDGQNLFQCVEPGCAWACDNYKEYVQHQKLHSSVAQDDENGGSALANQPPRKKAKTAAKPKAVPASMSVPVSHAEEHGDPAAHDFHGHGVGLDAYATAPAGLDFGEKDYYADRHRAYPLSAAPSTLLMMHKDAGREREDEYLPVDHRRAKSFLDERPRLPFPTRAFPSDSIAGPPVHGGIGSSFHFGSHLPPHRGPSYYDPPAPQQGGAGSPGAYHGGVSVSAAAYGGGYSSYARSSSESLAASYAPPAQAYYGAEAQQSLQFAPIRPEEPPSDDRYESSPHATSQAMRAPGQGGPSDGYAGSGHGMTQPEFTGEELSAVLELMKDS